MTINTLYKNNLNINLCEKSIFYVKVLCQKEKVKGLSENSETGCGGSLRSVSQREEATVGEENRPEGVQDRCRWGEGLTGAVEQWHAGICR